MAITASVLLPEFFHRFFLRLDFFLVRLIAFVDVGSAAFVCASDRGPALIVGVRFIA